MQNVKEKMKEDAPVMVGQAGYSKLENSSCASTVSRGRGEKLVKGGTLNRVLRSGVKVFAHNRCHQTLFAEFRVL